MTTLTLFSPSPNIIFQFSPTLDNNTYNITVTWNLFGQRWYINIFNLSNTLILSTPLIGSPDNYDINLVAGIFMTSTLIFRQSTQNFEVSP